MSLGSLIAKAKAHLSHNGMTYRQHFCFAACHGLRCIKAATLLIVHSIAPCFFQRAGSKLVERMSRDFVEHHIGAFIKREGKSNERRP